MVPTENFSTCNHRLDVDRLSDVSKSFLIGGRKKQFPIEGGKHSSDRLPARRLAGSRALPERTPQRSAQARRVHETPRKRRQGGTPCQLNVLRFTYRCSARRASPSPWRAGPERPARKMPSTSRRCSPART